MKKIGIITVLYNSAPVLEDFFKSLDEQTFKDFTLYIIDNKSSDDSLAVAERMSKSVNYEVVIMPQNDNYGVAKGNNIGIKKAIQDEVKYILLSNNDVVLDRDAIKNLLNGMLVEKATMAVPKVLFYDNRDTIAAVGSKFKYINCTTPSIGFKQNDIGQHDKNTLLGMASTCFMLIDVHVFKKTGFMDESYFVYYDDTDFVWRAVHDNKEKLVYIYSSSIWHRISYSTGGGLSNFSIYYTNRNRIYFSLKHYNIFQIIILCLFIITEYVLRSRWSFTKQQRQLYVKSICDGFKNFKEKRGK